jgi:hypothetical protein
LRSRAVSARERLSRCLNLTKTDQVQDRAGYASIEAWVALAEENYTLTLEAATQAVDVALSGGIEVAHEAVRIAVPAAADAALALGDLDTADRLLDALSVRPPGEVPPFLRLQLRRGAALVASARGYRDNGEQALTDVLVGSRELGYPYWTARAELDLADWLAAEGRVAEAARLAGTAVTTFDQLGVPHLRDRASRILSLGSAGAEAVLQSEAGSAATPATLPI